MALVYNPSTRTTSDIEGVTTRIPGAPPVGNVEDVEYLDTGLLMDYTAYYALTAQKLVALGYKANVTLHGAPYDFRRAANEQQEYFTELRNLIQKNYETVRCFLVSNAIIFSKGNVVVLFGKPPGLQNQCFSTYSNWEKSSNGVKYNYTPMRIVFGPIPDKDHGRNQHFLIC